MLSLIRLRPAATSLPATLRLPAVARSFVTSSPFFTDAQPAEPSSSVAPTPAAPATEAAPAAQAAPKSPFSQGPPMPFFINRTHSLNLPVYHRIKSGGTNKTTEIKKIEGDARVLSQMIASELALETKVNPVTNHISIKGLHRKAVESWLLQKGF